MNTTKQSLPTSKEWAESGFDVPSELCSDQPQPVAGHTLREMPEIERKIENNWPGVLPQLADQPAPALGHTPTPWHKQPIGGELYIESQGPVLICDMQRNECLVRENEALRRALEDIAPHIGNMLTRMRFTVALDAQVLPTIRAALALSTHVQAGSTPKPPSDAATGTPEGKEGVL